MGKKEPKQHSDSRSSKKHTPHPTTEASSSSTSSTPCGSKVDITIDDKKACHPVDEVITGNDIEALRVKEKDLMKLFSPKPPAEQRQEGVATRSVLVRKKQQRQAVGGDEHRTGAKRVAVLKPLPQGTGVTAVQTLGAPPAGPRVDGTGTFVPHSLLGEVEDFTAELQNTVSETTFNQTLNQLSALPPVRREPPRVEKVPRPSFHEQHAIDYESNALAHWSHCMSERRRQQEHLASTIHSSPSKLTMNHGDSFRETQEERTILDKATLSLDCGKGFGAGSEFIGQPLQLGDEQTGIRSTLTLTERGKPLELELVRVPDALQREKGLKPGSERNVPAHYTWKESPYLVQRRRYLRDILKETAPHPPDCSELQVIGQPLGDPAAAPDCHAPFPREGSLDSLEDGLSSDMEEEGEEGDRQSALLAEDPLASQPDVSFPHTGPALSINGDILQWEGPPKVSRSRTAHTLPPQEYCVSFTTQPNELVRSCLSLSNIGTTAMYYSWQHLPRANALGTVLSGDSTHQFYFDTRGGVMLPGEKLQFEFMFKAEKAGVFTESWSFQTGPVLCGGRPVLVRLTGFCYAEDIHDQQRKEITDKLMHEVAVTTAHKLINHIVDGICSPPRTPSPEVVSCLEEDVFTQRNPGFCYNFDAVAKLKSVYLEVMNPALEEEETRPPEPAPKSGKKEVERGKKDKPVAIAEEKTAEPIDTVPVVDIPDWDLSLTTLQELILGIGDDARREAKLVKMNDAVGVLSIPPTSRLRPSSAVHVRQLLSALMDDIDQASASLRLKLGLPPRPFSKGKEAEEDTQQPQGAPVSPAQSSKKKGSKENGKAKGTSLGRKSSMSNQKDEKAKTGGGVARKKSRQSSTPSPATQGRDQEATQDGEGGMGQPVPTSSSQNLATAERRYKELFYVRVHQLISSMAAAVGSEGGTGRTV